MEKRVTCANFEATSPRPECRCSWLVNGVSPLTWIVTMVMMQQIKDNVLMIVTILEKKDKRNLKHNGDSNDSPGKLSSNTQVGVKLRVEPVQLQFDDYDDAFLKITHSLLFCCPEQLKW